MNDKILVSRVVSLLARLTGQYETTALSLMLLINEMDFNCCLILGTGDLLSEMMIGNDVIFFILIFIGSCY